MKYEWDRSKELSNLKKHRICFKDAVEALNCGLIVVLKESYDLEEQRFVFLGMCKKLNILVVVTALPDEYTTRIISARKATKTERKFYETKL